MRILIYAPQSSGGSVFCYWLSQLEGYLSVIDLFVRCYPPPRADLDNSNIVLKATISDLDIDEHVRRFEPDRKILLVRNPYQIYKSLSTKPFRDLGGSIENKFEKLDRIFSNRSYFDAFVRYEDFVENREQVVGTLNKEGIGVSMKNYRFARSTDDIVTFNSRHSEELARSYNHRWGLGNIHKVNEQFHVSLKQSTVDSTEREEVERLCPNLAAFYAYRTLS